MNTPFGPFQPAATYSLPQMCIIFARPREKQFGRFLERDRSLIPRFLHRRCKDLPRCSWANGESMKTLRPVALCPMAEGEAAAL